MSYRDPCGGKEDTKRQSSSLGHEPLIDDGSIGRVVEVTVSAHVRYVDKIFTKAMAVSLQQLPGSSEKLAGGSMSGLCPGQEPR